MRRLRNQVRHYHWGSPTAIPRMLGRSPDGRPYAELWLGAHASAPSVVETLTGPVPLDAAIDAAPQEYLGAGVTSRFGARLPFLLKVLAARSPLSLQVHPNARQARTGFAAEEVAGVPRDGATRNYPDPFPKPELLVALGSFDALCGFRPPGEVAQDLGSLSGPLARDLRRELGKSDDAVRGAVSRALELRRSDPGRLLDGFLGECAEQAARGEIPASLRTAMDIACRFPGDPGAAIVPLLHRVSLAPGEALLVPPGRPHAHLGGVALEIMGSSNNVIRAGLTGKHVDPQGVLEVADLSSRPVPWVRPVRDSTCARYPVDYPEFRLDLINGGKDTSIPAHTPAVVLALSGACVLRRSDEELKLERGESAFVTAAGPSVEVRADGRTVLATVGSN
ncbi:mannose-6-phosphate isomerase, class I [Spiractinospora alimapuensis]|uniref:mannose-6-phosphate isomerase, class I n=1 Tax=Spiractinospora alimapuensis TaxID=2820884 RepID=UPI001EEA3B45|nr:mannose-6-phosphate isomerase, class I [Spiractinospora alimapuensis]QVQ53344.1 mannose-6-phosphate isomerase, class I [Spiractinospora alimapuensis]